MKSRKIYKNCYSKQIHTSMVNYSHISLKNSTNIALNIDPEDDKIIR